MTDQNKLPSVSINPSEQIVAAAVKETSVTAVSGMRIGLRKPGVLAQFRLIEMLEQTARNEVYVRMVLPLIYVAGINGEPVPPPTSKRELEALIQRLGEDGVAAVAEGVRDSYGGQQDPEQDKAALKN